MVLLAVLVSSAGGAVATEPASGQALALAPSHPQPAAVAQPKADPAGNASAQSPAVIAEAQSVITKTCVACHNDRTSNGGLSLASFQVATASERGVITEKMIRKLRAGQMPPGGSRRPDEAVLDSLADVLAAQADARAAAQPWSGRRSFQRLNRAEYARSIRDLLALDINAGDYLPLDEMSANFDNIADAQTLSPTLMQSYLSAAAEISRLAIGDRSATAREVTFLVPRNTSQRDRVPGAPYGTRGGVSVVHTFPADGSYRFRASFHHETTGALYGNGRAALHTADSPEQIEVSVDGERVALLDLDRWMNVSDPNGVNLQTEPIALTAGPHRISAVFIRRLEGPEQDLMSPLDWSIASTSIADAYGFTTLPHLRELAITGPLAVTGVSPTPSRQKLLTCQPTTPSQQVVCAREILVRVGSQAFRRPISERDADGLLALYKKAAVEGGFEAGIRMGLEAILASPRFVFRFEERPATAAAGRSYAVNDLDLASRLSFFLWATGPDDQLLSLATAGRLSSPATLEQQVRRMLADPKADALATRFGAQWLRLQDLDQIHPDVRVFPDFDSQLRNSMRRETELFVRDVVRRDRPVMDLFTADYTFVDQRLAIHYGMPNIVGSQFRKVAYPDARRRGLLGHGSILTLTSHADRTSPVLRGKWVLEVLLGTPPPAPPPDVPDLEATPDAEDGRFRTVRERMEQHRASAACTSCHRMIDPIGLALENFDVAGAWRIKDNGMPVDAASTLFDGSPLTGPEDLRRALLKRPYAMIQTFTENLATYALGRRLDPADMPMVRSIIRQAGASDQRFSAFVLGIVRSPAFRLKDADVSGTPTVAGGQQ